MFNVAQLRQYAQSLKTTWRIQDDINIVDSTDPCGCLDILGVICSTKNPTSINQLGEAEDTYISAIEELRELVIDEEQKQNLAQLEEDAGTQIELNRQLISMVDADRVDEAIELWKTSGALQSATELTAP